MIKQFEFEELIKLIHEYETMPDGADKELFGYYVMELVNKHGGLKYEYD